MLSFVNGVWFLDIIDLIKYNGIDIFDSIVNIPTSTWWIYWGWYFIILGLLHGLKALLDR